MAHNPYHVDPVYDINTGQSNTTTTSGAPNVGNILGDVGYDFGGSKYEKYFDAYDPTGEQLATQTNALNLAFQNQNLLQGTRNQLGQANQNTPFRGFTKSGGVERDLAKFREGLQTGYDNQQAYNRSMSSIGLQQDIYGMREDYKRDTRRTLIDLIQSGAELGAYETDFISDQNLANRTRGSMNRDEYETSLNINRSSS